MSQNPEQSRAASLHIYLGAVTPNSQQFPFFLYRACRGALLDAQIRARNMVPSVPQTALLDNEWDGLRLWGKDAGDSRLEAGLQASPELTSELIEIGGSIGRDVLEGE